MEHSFNVDLRGIVDLLSRHLYSSPRVYVRELLQNAVDAITARRTLQDGQSEDAVIRVEPAERTPDGSLRVHDNGIGLTEPEVHTLLATIGNSSKRDELGFSRQDFLGQFGIGLLSCFLVCDEVEVVTRSAAAPDAPTVVWTGRADGRYTVTEGEPRDEPGTTVTLRPRRDFEHWLSAATVTELARHYGSLLPYPLHVGEETVTDGAPPWLRSYAGPGERRDALMSYGRRLLGAVPLDVIDLEVPVAGLTGVAFVLPTEPGATDSPSHRVYLKRMLMGTKVEKLLPQWAFFVHCVIDAEELRPTASREQLYEDELLTATRDALGERLRDWLVRLATTDPLRLRDFLAVHHRGVLALAASGDVEMLRIVDEWIPFETNEGRVSLAEFRSRHRTIHYTLDPQEFRQLSGIAAAQGIGLVNGVYVHHTPVLRRLPAIDPDLVVRVLQAGELATRFEEPDASTAFAARDFLATAASALDRHACRPVLRLFSPAELPVLYLEDRDAREALRVRREREEADGVWADLLGLGSDGESDGDTRPQLVFNHRNPLVRRLTTTVDQDVVALSVDALYGFALLTGNRPLGTAEVAALNRAFLGLVEQAVHKGA